MQFGIIQIMWQKLYTYGVSLDAINTEAYLVLPDLHNGFDNYKHYLCHCQNQNNYMSFTHLLSSRKAWAKGRVEPEVHNYSQKKIVMAYSKRDSLRRFLPIRPSSRGSNKAPGSCRGLYFISGQTNHAFSEQREFGSYKNAVLNLYTVRTTNLFTWQEDEFLT
jgi:hypothetical protein